MTFGLWDFVHGELWDFVYDVWIWGISKIGSWDLQGWDLAV